MISLLEENKLLLKIKKLLNNKEKSNSIKPIDINFDSIETLMSCFTSDDSTSVTIVPSGETTTAECWIDETQINVSSDNLTVIRLCTSGTDQKIASNATFPMVVGDEMWLFQSVIVYEMLFTIQLRYFENELVLFINPVNKEQ